MLSQTPPDSALPFSFSKGIPRSEITIHLTPPLMLTFRFLADVSRLLQDVVRAKDRARNHNLATGRHGLPVSVGHVVTSALTRFSTPHKPTVHGHLLSDSETFVPIRPSRVSAESRGVACFGRVALIGEAKCADLVFGAGSLWHGGKSFGWREVTDPAGCTHDRDGRW